MTTKNFGAGVSPYLDVDGRSFETTVYQQSKPVLDSELNQLQDIQQGRARGVMQLAQSGWLGDILHSSDHASGIFLESWTENELAMPAMKALVNGWLIAVNNTGPTGTDYTSPPGGGGDDVLNLVANRVDLGPPPSGAGARRTDIVILEVWRRLLSASPSTDGKSHTGRIWRNGNVKIASGSDDLWLNYEDDILNAAVGAETTKRVQIQYRLRVIRGVDLEAYPSGMSDPSVAAFSVPENADAPDGVATAFTYASRSVAGDGGLWRAGDGDPDNDLGTVDGYIYALPLVAVFRRNTTAFARDTNHNGGSGRPDGLSATIIDGRDVFDLRSSISTTGWDLTELLQKSVNFVFDNALCTEFVTTPLGGGSTGHTNIWADEIGPTNNAGAEQIRTGFDGVCRRFSDRPILETVTVRYVPTDQQGGGATWSASTLNIDPTGAATPFRIYPYSSANFMGAAPDNVVILDILSIAQAGATNGTFIRGPYDDRSGSGSYRVLSSGDYTEISGLGTAGTVQLKFSGADPPAPSDPLFITLLVSYPGGAEGSAGGLSRAPTRDFGADSFVLENPAQLPATAPHLFQSLESSIDRAHREAKITYRTLSSSFTQTVPGSTFLADAPANSIILFVPERVAATPTPTVTNTTTGDTYTGTPEVSSDGRVVFVSDQGADWAPSGVAPVPDVDQIEISYEAIRPIPNNGVQFTIWYETRAPQTVRSELLGTTLTVIPRYIASDLYTLVSGSGSLDEAYPFPQQSVQTPGVYPSSAGAFDGDHELAGAGQVSISDFNAQTGFLRVPVLIPAVPQPQNLTFIRDPGDNDIEGRSFFKEVAAGYIPSSFGQPLSNSKRHKNVLPMIAELDVDGPIGAKGTLLLVLLSRWAVFDANNYVGFEPDLGQNFTTASVYRLKGNPLNARRT